jgi:lipoprotein-releasing system permease protein
MNLSAWVPFEWMMAFRFLKEGRIQTAFIIIGISIGVAVIVFMSALLSAMQANFVNRVLTGQSHIQITAQKEKVIPLMGSEGLIEFSTIQVPLQRYKSIDQWQRIAEELSVMTDVQIVSPAVTGSALLQRGESNRSVNVIGMIPEVYFKIIPLHEKVVQGHANVQNESVVIGTDLATDLGVMLGDKLRFEAGQNKLMTLQVAGIFDFGNKAANSRNVFVSMRTAQSMFGLLGGASLLDVNLTDVYAADNVAMRIEKNTGLQAHSWIKTNEQFFTAVKAQTTANTAIRLFVGLSVGFGIASVLVVSVVQRSREIGILRAMGVTRGQVLRIFLLQGGLLGLAGALLGACLGGWALILWQKFQRNADGTVMFELSFDGWLLLQTLLLATMTGLIAALAPAQRAAMLDPAVAIRG